MTDGKMNSELCERIARVLQSASSPDRVFPATTLYNEGWLLWLVLDWFSVQPHSSFPLSFNIGARWFSEGLLRSRFLARSRGDKLAEGWTNADGVIGHITVGSETSKANVGIQPEANQLLVVEAKVFSKLSSGVANAKYFDQAARSVACLAEMIRISASKVEDFDSLGLLVLAPECQIEAGVFLGEVNKDSILEKVKRRVREYGESDMDSWFDDWFLPVLERAMVGCISWEDIIGHIKSADSAFGEDLNEFFSLCLRFNAR